MKQTNHIFDVTNYHLTDACNYKCAHCFGKFPDTKELNYQQACAVVDNIARCYDKNGIAYGRINLAGGEPLLCPYLDDLIDYINAYGLKVSIITNGSLLTKERIALWKGKVDIIGLSIDSALPETNVAIGRCCNNKTLTVKQAVSITQAIHRNGIKLKINTAVSKLNVEEDLRTLYKRLKPDRLKLLQMTIVEGTNDSARKNVVSKAEFKSFCKRHKNCCNDTVCESSDDMENSYLMINPQGVVQLNDSGKYITCGNCLTEELDEILKSVRIDEEKFNYRYGNKSAPNAKNGKIYVFGGHETFIKNFKEFVPNARIIKDDNLHSLDIIRNAEEIWIQRNAISHSFYNKLVDAAKANDTTVNYFGFDSAKKCAEQILSKHGKQFTTL